MTVEINHLIIPATDKVASARFLAAIVGLEPGEPVAHFQPVQVGSVTLDYDNSNDIRPMRIAFLVDDATFDLAHQRLIEGHVPTYADPAATSRARSTAASVAAATTSTTPTSTSSNCSPQAPRSDGLARSGFSCGRC